MADGELRDFVRLDGIPAPSLSLTRIQRPFRPSVVARPIIEDMRAGGVPGTRRRLFHFIERSERLVALLGVSTSLDAEAAASTLHLIEGRPGTLALSMSENTSQYTVTLLDVIATPTTDELIIPGTRHSFTVRLSCRCEYKVIV